MTRIDRSQFENPPGQITVVRRGVDIVVTIPGEAVPWSASFSMGNNKLALNRQGARYRKWKKGTAQSLQLLLDDLITPLKLGVDVYRRRRSGDYTNFVKAAEDALVASGKIHDDSPKYIDGHLAGVWRVDKENPRLVLTIRESRKI